MAKVEEINEEDIETREIEVHSKSEPTINWLTEEEEDEKKHSPEAKILHDIIKYTFTKVFNIAAPYLPAEVKGKAFEGVNSILSLNNVEKALGGDFKPILDSTKKFGAELFGDIFKGATDLAINCIENGAKFLSGIVGMFAGKISEKVAEFGAPEQTRSDIEKIASGFDKTVKALTFDSKEQVKSQSTPSEPERRLDSNLGKALSEINSAFSKEQEITV